FVKTSGQGFTLNGGKFTVVGDTDINKAFTDISKTGATVVRTWGFNEVTNSPGVPYYQSWSGSTPTVNTGADGLQNFAFSICCFSSNIFTLVLACINPRMGRKGTSSRNAKKKDKSSATNEKKLRAVWSDADEKKLLQGLVERVSRISKGGNF
ncbi:hypothetical protein MPER_02476, partial [Moniliophthora perniciosa FA553]